MDLTRERERKKRQIEHPSTREEVSGIVHVCVRKFYHFLCPSYSLPEINGNSFLKKMANSKEKRIERKKE